MTFPPGAVVGFVPDLMDRSKLAGVRFVRTPDLLTGAEEPVVVLDLSRPPAVAQVATLVAAGKQVLGFASHVDREGITEARTLGCTVWARSEFFRRWPALPGLADPDEGPPGPQ